MWYSAGVRPNSNTATTLAKLNAYICHNYSSSNDNFIQKYLLLVKQILLAKRGNIELICIYDLLNAELDSLNKQCDDLLESFTSALRDVSEYTRVLVAQSVGILWSIGTTVDQFNGYVSKPIYPLRGLHADDADEAHRINYLSNNNLCLQIKDMLSSLSQRQIEHRHGSLLALSHAIHRRLGNQRKNVSDTTLTTDCNEINRVITILIEYLSDQQPLLVSAAISGISLIGSVISLPLENHSAKGSSESSGSTAVHNTYDCNEQMDVDGDSKTFTKAYVAQTILHLLRSAHSRPKIREEAAHCLGQLAVGDGAYFTQGNLDAFSKLIKLVSWNCIGFT